MKYSVIRDVMKQINDCSGGIYYYLISQDGEMIYHPRGTELNRGLFEENSLETAKYEDGTYEIHSNSQNETVIVGSVAYTGWKMIGVVPESVQAANYKNFRYYVFATVLVLMVMLLEGNQLVSRKNIQTDPGAGCFRQGPRGRRKTGYLYRRLLGDPPSGTFCAEVL